MNEDREDTLLKQVEIYRAANPHQAQILVNLLKNEGIWAAVLGDGLVNSTADMGWAVNPKVMVRQQDQNIARAIALDFEQQIATRKTEVDLDSTGELDAELLADIRRGEDWPSCPACFQLRIAVCPNCEQSGTKFEAAEFISSSETGAIYDVESETDFEIVPSELRLMCSVCDRAFAPVYQKCCHCGYEFPDGLESQLHHDHPLNRRAFFVFVAIFVALGIVLFCLYSVLN